MTVFGGEETASGTVKDGFLVVCCKCGWHSTVEVDGSFFRCLKCGNEYNLQ